MSGAQPAPPPDLQAYRRQFEAEGVKPPLPPVPTSPAGLLSLLPPAPVGRRGWPWDRQEHPRPPAGRTPRISVVVPSFEQGAYLEATLRSLLLQNYPALEILVIDGGSRDGTQDVLDRYRPWLSFALSRPDRGQAHAINLGFSLVTGEVLTWLNSDDLHLPWTLRRIAAAFTAGVEVVHGDALAFEEETGRFDVLPSQPVRARYSRFGGLLLQPSTFWRRGVHQPLQEGLHCALDYELWIRLLPGRRIHRLEGMLSLARRHPESKTCSPRTQALWAADAALNQTLHGSLYRQTWWNRLIRREHQVVRSLDRRRTLPRLQAALPQLLERCGWTPGGGVP